ncbi:MAG TPA: hypothetical protein PLU50_10920, partial [Pseudobdellovibrionaceae bacterium]|nr:hypothetical protein [Pseudobdellovibrionaceae bacterium]
MDNNKLADTHPEQNKTPFILSAAVTSKNHEDFKMNRPKLNQPDFHQRHIGPQPHEIQEMLQIL